MIIVNTTFTIDTDLVEETLRWIYKSYIRSAAATACVHPDPMLTRVLGQDDAQSCTFALHIYFPDVASACKWVDGVGASLLKILIDRHGGRVLAFVTQLEVIDLKRDKVD